MARLIMRRGPRPGQTFELHNDVVTIGSGSKNDIVILDNDVSREHCRLVRVMTDYELEDLKSGRGTFVSGQRVESGWLLKPGSFIELGENITLEYDRGDTSLEMPKVPSQALNAEGPDPNVHPYLVMTVGLNPGQVHPLKSRTVRLGRDLSNDIVLQDPEVSRFHLLLRWTDKGYQIEDLNSTNGTRVNGVTIAPDEPHLLRANDMIQLATMAEFRYTWQPGDVAPLESSTKSTRRVPPKLDTSEINILGPKRHKHQTSRLGTGLQPGSLVDHLFIAYAREEWEAIVAPLMAILQDAGLKVWVDQYLVQGGDDWMLAVEQALSECWLLLLVVSPASLESRYVRLAYRYFLNREKPIIPMLYVAVENLPLELSNSKSIRYDSHNRRQSFDALIGEIRQRR
jgi:pSer/pThr/pTyr-binding forkhead associated (FHA) protein